MARPGTRKGVGHVSEWLSRLAWRGTAFPPVWSHLFSLFIVIHLSSLAVRQRAERLQSFSLPRYLSSSSCDLTSLISFNDHEREMSNPHKAVPLVAPGHTRPITHLSFSPLLDDGTYLLISSCKDGNPMLREWTGDWIGTFVGHKGAVWCTKLSQEGSRAASGSADFTACVSLSYGPYVQSHSRASLCPCCSKIWDTYSGQPLHSFPHNHIVRSVAISPSYLLTGGQEKKVRIFDIGKPEAEPDILSEGGGQSHDGTIKSVVWFDENTGVSGGEDRIIKWVIYCLS